MKRIKRIPMAICYDFDGTLSPRCMQEYGFIPQLGLEAATFWKESNTAAHHNHIVPAGDRQLSWASLKGYGRSVELFAGLTDWFRRINAYGRRRGLAVEHYIISSGLKEILQGTPIAKSFTAIFASSFIYDSHGNAVWPAQSVNYTNKTQFLFRINKGCLDIGDDRKINRRIPESEKHMPFSRMISIGDGETDVVYQEHIRESRENAQLMLDDHRADFAAPADYRAGRPAALYVRALIDKIAADTYIQELKKNTVID